jgi:aminopeptidase YwaD
MKNDTPAKRAAFYVRTLCRVKPNRSTGSKGNRAAAAFCAGKLKGFGYQVETAPFSCLDFDRGIASLTHDGAYFPVYPSPFSPGCDVKAELAAASTLEELEAVSCNGKLLLLRGGICSEQLMPKRFPFYKSDRHGKIIALIEKKRPAAVITATGKNPELVGAEYPFPMIEDGDMNIPSVYCKDYLGRRIASKTGRPFRLISTSRRIRSKAANVIARRNPGAARKTVVCAHIDARANTPGASDNAAGVSVLLLLAEMLAEVPLKNGLEIVAFNGEDHYSAAGQKDYLRRHGRGMRRIGLVINVDDIGYKKGKTAYSFYQCLRAFRNKCRTQFRKFDGLTEGEPWVHGDHMIFVQRGLPAIALTSQKMRTLMAKITHTPKDVPGILDFQKLAETASALKALITEGLE